MGGRIRGFFGGAFDPVHFGHIKPALELAAHPRMETVHFVPCGAHPEDKRMAPAEHRVRMLELVRERPQTDIETCSIKDNSLCYTVDLMTHIRNNCAGQTPVAFVLGYDSYLGLSEWRRADEIPGLAHLIVLARADEETPERAHASLDELAESPCGLTHFFDNRRCDISSTRVRDALGAGRPPRGLVPGVVWNYIRRNNLYGAGA